ncbi:MAG: hypothetical protein DRQ78_00885 [Epsilonproteobacteria bacterium]|nr:MAG: hypothetical protein DRQ78_00885 [Campylobacterota bacterium]
MTKETSKIATEIKDLRLMELKNRQLRVRYGQGTIKHVSPQGDSIWVTVQRHPVATQKEDGTTEIVDGLYYGNEGDLPPEEITMSELLIPLNVNLSTLAIRDYEDLRNQVVTVHVINGFPKKAELLGPVNSTFFKPVDIKTGRITGPNKSIQDKEFDTYLLRAGYSQEDIDAMKEYTLASTPTGVLNFGTSEWTKGDSERPDGVDKTEVAKSGIVTDLPLTADKSNNICYKPVKALTAR